MEKQQTMERKGQIFLVIGIFLTLFSVFLTKDYVPDANWIRLMSDITLLLSAVMVVWGIVLVVRAKFRKHKQE